MAQERDVRLHVSSAQIPIRTAIVELARIEGLALDLGGRPVEGVIEIASDEGVRSAEVWRIVNEQLAQRGVALVRRPTQDTLTLVTLAEAPTLARLEPRGLETAHAGFVRILYRASSVAPGALADALRSLLPEARTKFTALDDAGHLAIAGLRADVEQALVVLELIDSGLEPPVSTEVRIRNRSTVTIGARLEQIVQKRASSGQRLQGWHVPLPEASSILIVAPEEEVSEWTRLIAQLDDDGGIETRHYVPTRFGVSETAALIREVVEAGAGDVPGWRLVEDELTGTLIVTASVAVHERVEGIIERLEGSEAGARRRLGSFEVRHRDAESIVELLERLLDPDAAFERTAAEPAAVQPTEARPARSTTEPEPDRDVQLTVDTATNRILVFADPPVLRQIEQLLAQLDTVEPQVLIEATVVSLTDSEVNSLGVELRAAGSVGSSMGEVGSFFGLGVPELSAASAMTPGLAGGVGVILNPGDFAAVVQALRTVNDGRSLTRPRVVTRNHATADLNSVVESPFAAVVATQVVATTTFGGSSEAGTIISVTPHLTSGDRIRLEYGITLSAFVGEPADPALPPPRQQTVLSSEAVLPDGHTVVLGGLELDSTGTSESSVPWLGRIPLLGWAFRDRSTSQQTTRFYVFLRCEVLRGESFRALREITVPSIRAAGIADDVPSLEPRWMR
ncbi:MAG: secretin N-terminal domain-containing protein [Planctomycetota bacterium]